MNENATNKNVRHERRDVNVRALALIVAAIAVLGVIGHFSLRGVFNYMSADHERNQPQAHPLAETQSQVPPQPRLEVEENTDLARIHAEESKNLNEYGWVDRKAGRIRIPIDRAMELTVQRQTQTKEKP